MDSVAVMPGVFWNPFSISFFVQLIILVLCTGYILLRAYKAARARQAFTSTLAVAALHISLTVYIGLMFLRVSLHQDIAHVLVPWMALPGLCALFSFMLFAYNYPRRLVSRASWEARLVFILAVLLVSFETAVAVERHSLQLQGYIEFRPAWMDLLWAVVVTWTTACFIRQYLLERSEQEPGGVSPARAFLIISFSPALLLLILVLASFQIVSALFREIAVCWTMLLIIASFALTYLNYAPERSSFIVKLAGISLTIILGVISTISWLIGPIYADAYQNERLVSERTAIRFVPNTDGGYDVNRTAYRFDRDMGELHGPYDRVELPFAFPLFGVAHDTAFLHPAGFLSFSDYMYLREAIDRYGVSPAIFPLATDMTAPPFVEGETTSGPGMYVRFEPDRAMLTWYQVHAAYSQSETYTFQLVLYPRGVIEVHYIDFPDKMASSLSPARAGPMFVGVSPGYLSGDVQTVDFQSQLPFRGAAGMGVVDDYRLDHLSYLNQIYRPVALFILAISLVTLLALPFFLRVNLALPLQRLLTGVEKYRSGRFSGPIPVTYRDEIGYITEAFNGLAEKQTELIDTLEEQVAERSAAASQLAAENARLAERNHLSSELHDAVSQTLFSSSLLADTLPRLLREQPDLVDAELERLRFLNRNALAEMRTLLMELRPGRITEGLFGGVLRELISAAQTGGETKLNLTIESDCHLPDAVQVTFYRFAQESLNNVQKHAGANRIDVYFDGTSDQALLSVTDNGRGFDQNAVPAGHMGLQIMRDRIHKIGGHLEIESTPGKGTKLTLIWAGDDV